MILIIKSAKHECVIVKPTQVKSHESTMSERIYMPAYMAFKAEFGEYPITAVHHVENHIFSRWISFIWHAPPTVNKVQLSISHQGCSSLLTLSGLFILPSREECNFHLGELSLRIGDKSTYNGIYYWPYVGPLDVISQTFLVFINWFQPAYVIMSMGSHLHCQFRNLIKYSFIRDGLTQIYRHSTSRYSKLTFLCQCDTGAVLW